MELISTVGCGDVCVYVASGSLRTWGSWSETQHTGDLEGRSLAPSMEQYRLSMQIEWRADGVGAMWLDLLDYFLTFKWVDGDVIVLNGRDFHAGLDYDEMMHVNLMLWKPLSDGEI